MKQIVESVADLIEVGTRLVDNQGAYSSWWRGQSDARWSLTPGIYRDRGEDRDREVGLVLRYMREARTRFHGSCPGRDDRVAWLSLMQHYRLPTRLLDWTESPLTAAYFAASDGEESDGCIYALYPFWLNFAETGVKAVFPAFTDEAEAVVAAAFGDEPSEQAGRTLAIATDEIDTRQLIQQSRFTLHGSTLPLDQVTDSDCFLYRFTLPAATKRRVLDELYMLGIRESYLYPDLEHLGRELRSTRLQSAKRACVPRPACEL